MTLYEFQPNWSNSFPPKLVYNPQKMPTNWGRKLANNFTQQKYEIWCGFWCCGVNMSKILKLSPWQPSSFTSGHTDPAGILMIDSLGCRGWWQQKWQHSGDHQHIHGHPILHILLMNFSKIGPVVLPETCAQEKKLTPWQQKWQHSQNLINLWPS